MKPTIEITGDDFFLDPMALPEDMRNGLIDCSTPGQDALPEVQAFLTRFEVVCDPDLARAYLRPYGAWGESELYDHESNVERLVWLMACDIAETGEAYLSVY
jgi:hypothetical protein